MLCENGWEGGYGYVPKQVAELTLDQIFMLMADKKILRAFGSKHTSKVKPMEMLTPNKDNMVRGRSVDGTPIKGRITGKSLARQLMEEEAKRK